MAGFFLVLEGADGTGKTSLAAALAPALTGLGHRVLATREPGGTEIGKALRELLLHPPAPGLDPRSALALVMAARIEHVRQRIAPALAAGQLVLCDRFLGSTLAYQGGGDGLDQALIRGLHRALLDDLRPDLTLLLDLDPEAALARAAARGPATVFEQRGLDYQTRVRASFRALAGAEGWVMLDSARSPAALLQGALAAVTARLAPPGPPA